MIIRVALCEDLKAIVDIYNQAVAKQATADMVPLLAAERRTWFTEHCPERFPILVAESEAEVVGWASLSAYRPGRGALRHTAEISYYVDAAHFRRGIAARLIDALIERAPVLGIRTLFAILLEDNQPSIAILERFGFGRWGFLPRVADFQGREVGHLYYGLRLSEPEGSDPGR